MTTSATTTSPSRGQFTDDDIRPYLGYIDATAARLASTPDARRAGAEYDDLRQEGMQAVLFSLQRGTNPFLVIENRMKDWITYMQRQRKGDPIPYEVLLSTDVPVGTRV